MLSKLLKYDLKWIYKFIIIFYSLAIVFSTIGRIFAEFDNSLLFSILSKIAYGTAISMMVSSLINCLMRLWTRMVRNLYKDESYLTHTLPVSKNDIYLSKMITGVISVLTTIVVILLCLFICYYSKENMEVLKNLLQIAASTYNTSVVKLLFLVFLVFFVEILYMLVIGYAGIIIGHRFNKGKMIKSVFVGLLMYFGTQSLSIALLFIYGIINPDIMNLINTTSVVSIDTIKILMYLAVIIYLIYTIIFYWIGKTYLNKGVNVE